MIAGIAVGCEGNTPRRGRWFSEQTVARCGREPRAARSRLAPLLPKSSDVRAPAVAVVVAVRSLALAKAIEDPEGGAQGCAPFFIGTGMSRMKKPCVGIARAGW